MRLLHMCNMHIIGGSAWRQEKACKIHILEQVRALARGADRHRRRDEPSAGRRDDDPGSRRYRSIARCFRCSSSSSGAARSVSSTSPTGSGATTPRSAARSRSWRAWAWSNARPAPADRRVREATVTAKGKAMTDAVDRRANGCRRDVRDLGRPRRRGTGAADAQIR